jgi:hypothetical protein
MRGKVVVEAQEPMDSMATGIDGWGVVVRTSEVVEWEYVADWMDELATSPLGTRHSIENLDPVEVVIDEYNQVTTEGNPIAEGFTRMRIKVAGEFPGGNTTSASWLRYIVNLRRSQASQD